MNQTQRWLAMVRPRHNPAENALIANMREIQISRGRIALRQCATTPASAGRMTQPYNRSFPGYGSGINAGRHDDLPKGTRRRLLPFLLPN